METSVAIKEDLIEPLPSEAIEQEQEINFCTRVSRFIIVYRRSLVVVFGPILLLPIAIQGQSKSALCLYVISWMTVWWVTEAIPVAITSLLPIILFPIMDILSTVKTCSTYISDMSMSLLGTYIFGQCIHYCMLDQRIALKILNTIGCKPVHLHIILMCTSFFMSMWILNMAVVALMCPIVEAILRELEAHGLCRQFEDEGKEIKEDSHDPRRPSRTALCFYMGISYAAVFGGCSTLIGTSTNAVMVEMMYKYMFRREVPFLDFTYYALPVMLVLVILSTVYLQWLYMGLFRRRDLPEQTDCLVTQEALNATQERVAKEYSQLEPMAFHEKFVIGLFVGLVVLLITRKPGFYRGWNCAFFKRQVSEATVATFILILLFTCPSHLSFLNYFRSGSDYLPQRRSRGVISWHYVRSKVPWRIIFLMGGGLALAEGSRATLMANQIAHFIHSFGEYPKIILSFILNFPVFLLTQVFGNSPLAYTILPVLIDLAECHRIHPTYFMIPTTLMCSLALTTPVGAGVNALIVGFANIRSVDVVISGIVPALTSFVLIWLSFPTYGALFFPEIFQTEKNSTRCSVPHDLRNH